MSMLILNQYHKNAKPNARSDRNGPEPPPDISAAPQPVQDGQDNLDTGAETEQPIDPEARREKALTDAQARWARRRKEGYEDYGAEMGKDAKVWETYVKETDRSDHELVEGWNKSLDVLLIFAALFSAISTAFVIVSSEGLQQDPADTSAQTLLTISQALVAISNGQPVNASGTAEQDPSLAFRPSHAAMIVNTLWYLSLSLSVAVSLVAMLAKEWCYSFMANRTGQMYEQGRRRQERWNGILRWKMKDVIAFLPMVMHSALFLFALGLCVYLWSICIPVALPVVVTTGAALLIYFSTTVLPLLFDFCPYTTESSRLFQSYLKLLKLHFSSVLGLVQRSYNRTLDRMTEPRYRRPIGSHERFGDWKRMRLGVLLWTDNVLESCAGALMHLNSIIWSTPVKSVQVAEPKLIMADGKVPMDTITSEMLAWLLTNSEDSKVTTIALQSLAGADPWLPRLPLLQNGILRLLHQRLEGCLELDVKQNEYRLRDPALVHSASLYFRGLNLILSYHNSEGFYLDYHLFGWAGYEPHLTYFQWTEAKNTWSFDVDNADIRGLLTAGTHGSALKLSMEYTGLPELVLFANICPQAVTYAMSFTTPHYVSRTIRQTEILALLGQFIDETIIVHTHAIVTIVRRETELLCARYADFDGLSSADQLAFPIILVKLSCLPSIRKDLDALHAIAIALMVTAFVFVGDSLQKYPLTHPSQSVSRPSVAASYHYRPKLLTNEGRQYLSLEASRRKETESLLAFGLLALFEHPDAHALCDADIAAIARGIESIGRSQSSNDPVTYTHIHTLSEDFTYADHNQRVTNQLCSLNQANTMHDAITRWHCIPVLHNTQCIREPCSHYIDHLKIWCHAESAELRPILFDMIGPKPFPPVPPEQELCDLLSSSNVLSKLDLALLLSINGRDTLVLMDLLWRLIEWIYKNEDSVRQTLSSIMPENNSEIPDSIWSLGLIERWFPKLKSLCSTDPQMVAESRAVQHILGSFEHKHNRSMRRFRWLGSDSRSGDLSDDIIVRAVQRYQQHPDQCKVTRGVEAIHKIALMCVSGNGLQDGFDPSLPPPELQIPDHVSPQATLASGDLISESDEDPHTPTLPAGTGAEMC